MLTEIYIEGMKKHVKYQTIYGVIIFVKFMNLYNHE